MNTKELDDLHQCLHAALNIVKDDSERDDPEELQVIGIFNECTNFKRMVRAGCDECLIDTGNGPIDDGARDIEAETKRAVKMTVKELHTAIHVAISLGVDIGVAMMQCGAKFPGPKVN